MGFIFKHIAGTFHQAFRYLFISYYWCFNINEISVVKNGSFFWNARIVFHLIWFDFYIHFFDKKKSIATNYCWWILWFFFSRLTGTLKMYVRKYFKPFEHVISYQSITWNKVLALAKVRNADFVVNISLLQSTLLLHNIHQKCTTY